MIHNLLEIHQLSEFLAWAHLKVSACGAAQPDHCIFW